MERKKEIRILPVDTAELRVSRDADGAAKIEGYSAVFNSLSEDLGGFREKIEPGAFKKSIGRSDARGLFNHDANYVLGRQSNKTLRIKEDDKGLFMSVDVPDTQIIRDLVLSPIERGDITQQSFAFTVASDKWDGLEDRSGDKMPTRTILEVHELFDVSPVTYPAYPDTTVAARSLEEARESIEIHPFMLLSVPELLEAYAVAWRETQDKVDHGEMNPELVELSSRIMTELKDRLSIDGDNGIPTNADDSGIPTNTDKGIPTNVDEARFARFDNILEKLKK